MKGEMLWLHYSTERTYQTIHWLNGLEMRPTEILSEISNLFGISVKVTKGDSFPKKFRSKMSRMPNCALFVSGFPKLSKNEKLIKNLGDALYKSGNVSEGIVFENNSEDKLSFVKTAAKKAVVIRVKILQLQYQVDLD